MEDGDNGCSTCPAGSSTDGVEGDVMHGLPSWLLLHDEDAAARHAHSQYSDASQGYSCTDCPAGSSTTTSTKGRLCIVVQLGTTR